MITLAPLALALLAQAAPVTTALATAESFVPAHSFAVLRVKSLDRLSELALPFQRIEDEQAQPLDVLAQLGGMFGVEAQWELIDHTQPFVFAVSSSKSNQPAAFTVIATAKDAATLAADPQWKHSGWTCTQHSSFVTITTEPSDALLAKDSPLLVGLAGSDVAVRVDVQEVMAQYGEEFRQGVQAGFEGGPAAELNDEQATTVQTTLDGMLDFVDSMETIGLTLHGTGESMRLAFEMSGVPGSPWVDVAKVDPKPLEALARSIDPSAPIAFLGAMDLSKWMTNMKSLMEIGATLSPDESQAGMREMFANLDDFYALVGPYWAGGMRFDRNGIATTYALRPTSVPQLIESYTKMLRIPDMPFDIEGPTTETVVGHEVTRYRLKMNPDKVPGMAAVDSPVAAATAAANEMMTKFFGGDAIPFSYTTHEGALLLSMGRDTEMAAAITRVAATTQSPVGAEMLALLGPLNPGMAMRFDTSAIVEGFLEIGHMIEGEPAPNAAEIQAAFKDCAPVRMTVGLDQRTWRMTFDVDAVRMMKAFASLPQDEVGVVDEMDGEDMDDVEPETK